MRRPHLVTIEGMAGLSDRELLLLVLELMEGHIQSHRWWAGFWRWAVSVFTLAVGALVTLYEALRPHSAK